jgi:hypothetical protein
MDKDEALKLAIGKIKSARDCHFAAIDPLLFEAEEILEQALAAPVQEPYAWHYKNAAGVSAWHFGPSRMFDADLEASKMWPRTHQLIPVYTENRRSISDCEELAALGWQAITCPSCGNVGARGYPRNAAPPAQPAPVQPVQEPVAWRKFNGFRFDYIEHQPALSGMVSKEWKPLYDTTPPAAQPAVPDAIHHTDLSESLEYIQGWNECRQAMLEMMK